MKHSPNHCCAIQGSPNFVKLKISADSGVRETAGVTKHFALSRDEKQKPDGAEYPCMETEYIPYLHFIRFHDY